MKNIFLASMALIFFAFVSACSPEDEINPNDKNAVVVEFENIVGGQRLALNTVTYTNPAGEPFTITRLNYFVSNVKLTKSDGQVVSFPDRYFLIRQADANSLKITLPDVPAGDYIKLDYLIGVDSLRSVADISQRTGVLDPASYGDDNMYWSWNSGYIFFKMEGTSPRATTPAQNFQFHIGGFGGYSARTAVNSRTISLPMAQSAQVRKNVSPTIHVLADVQKVFSAGHTINARSMVHSPAVAAPVADGVKNMFAVDHVHNDKMP